jgi:hypothetical protein
MKSLILHKFITENLEKKMASLKNFERLQELQQQIVWQSILELEPRTFVPEVCKSYFIYHVTVYLRMVGLMIHRSILTDALLLVSFLSYSIISEILQHHF